jgi:general secretion pathway protein M
MRYWANLQKREKLVVSWGGALLLVVLGYVLVVAPLRKNLVHMAEDSFVKKADLLWMQEGANEARRLTALRSNKSAVSPLKIIDQTARRYNIDSFLKRVDPGQGDKIKVWFEGVVFVDFMGFLRRIGAGKGLVISNLSVERLDAPGIVNARVTFKAAGK